MINQGNKERTVELLLYNYVKVFSVREGKYSTKNKETSQGSIFNKVYVMKEVSVECEM